MADDPTPARSPGSAGRNARMGLWLFLIYLLLYGGFMGLATFSFKTLGEDIAGVNWAIFYGMGLIFAALVLAVVYMLLCKPSGEHADTIKSEGGE